MTLAGGLKADMFLKARGGMFRELYVNLMQPHGERALISTSEEGLERLRNERDTAVFLSLEGSQVYSRRLNVYKLL